MTRIRRLLNIPGWFIWCKNVLKCLIGGWWHVTSFKKLLNVPGWFLWCKNYQNARLVVCDSSKGFWTFLLGFCGVEMNLNAWLVACDSHQKVTEHSWLVFMIKKCIKMLDWWHVTLIKSLLNIPSWFLCRKNVLKCSIGGMWLSSKGYWAFLTGFCGIKMY